jgi:hypothetical protein
VEMVEIDGVAGDPGRDPWRTLRRTHGPHGPGYLVELERMPPAKRLLKRATAAGRPKRRATVKAARPGPGHNKPDEAEALPRPMPPPMPAPHSEDETASQIVQDIVAHRRKFVAAVTNGTVGEGGPPFALASAELVLQRAREVERAIHKLPLDAPLGKADRQKIRRALSVLTDGQVGGFKFKLKDPKAAKRKAGQTLKHYAETVVKVAGAATKVAGAVTILLDALQKLVNLLTQLGLNPNGSSPGSAGEAAKV